MSPGCPHCLASGERSQLLFLYLDTHLLATTVEFWIFFHRCERSTILFRDIMANIISFYCIFRVIHLNSVSTNSQGTFPPVSSRQTSRQLARLQPRIRAFLSSAVNAVKSPFKIVETKHPTSLFDYSKRPLKHTPWHCTIVYKRTHLYLIEQHLFLIKY